MKLLMSASLCRILSLQEAMKAANQAGIPYVRFERQTTIDLSGATVVHSTEEAIEYIKEKEYKTVYLGTGSKTLPLFVHGVYQSRVLWFVFFRLQKF